MTEENPKLIHVGRIQKTEDVSPYLFLRKTGEHAYTWMIPQSDGKEIDTGVKGETVEGAMQLAQRQFRDKGFRTVICGFRYTLPERDEHGINALFHQMVESYGSPTGVYYDEDLGHNCFVQNASTEALNLWRDLRQSHRL